MLLTSAGGLVALVGVARTREAPLQLFNLTDLQSITQVCRLWADVGKEVLMDRVRRELKRHILPGPDAYSNSPTPQLDAVFDFLSLLDDTGSVVSGTTALAACMYGTPYIDVPMSDSDLLDIFTPREVSTHVVYDLKKMFGYTVDLFVDRHYARYYGNHPDAEWFALYGPEDTGIDSFTRLQRPDGRAINVMASTAECALLPLARFPFTHVINYTTGTTLVVCYPIHTLVEHRGVDNPDTAYRGPLLARYEYEGWDLLQSHGDGEHTERCFARGSYCPNQTRITDDELCFSFRFKVDDVQGGRKRTVSRFPRAMWIWGWQWSQGMFWPSQYHYITMEGAVVDATA